MSESLLTLVCPPSLERSVSDWLLEYENISGFTSMHAHGHGSDPRIFSLLEQVEGRKKQIIFQIHMSTSTSEKMLTELRNSFKGTDIHYWLLPVTESGHLDSESKTAE